MIALFTRLGRWLTESPKGCGSAVDKVEIGELRDRLVHMRSTKEELLDFQPAVENQSSNLLDTFSNSSVQSNVRASMNYWFPKEGTIDVEKQLNDVIKEMARSREQQEQERFASWTQAALDFAPYAADGAATEDQVQLPSLITSDLDSQENVVLPDPTLPQDLSHWLSRA